MRAPATLCFGADGWNGKRAQAARGGHGEGTDDGDEGVLRGLLLPADHPDGLRPPQQLRFVFRQERRARTTWAFPTAEEQAALHAA